MYDPENKKTPTEVDVLIILVEHRGIEQRKNGSNRCKRGGIATSSIRCNPICKQFYVRLPPTCVMILFCDIEIFLDRTFALPSKNIIHRNYFYTDRILFILQDKEC